MVKLKSMGFIKGFGDTHQAPPRKHVQSICEILT